MMFIFILIFAFILDSIFGDPKDMPHPVRLVGRLIISGEKCLRNIFPKTENGEKAAGGVLVLFITILSFTVPFFILFFAYRISFLIGTAVNIFFCYQILAVKSMKDAALPIEKALDENDTGKARRLVSRIVGRDTDMLDEKGITRACVETVSENLCDGAVAPLFFMALGGAPLGFLYKSVNTMDSMIGYKNEKYKNFGFFAAKLDDILNFIPARISGFLFAISAYILGYDGKSSFRIFLRDRLKHPSPNSGHAEAAAAGALNIALGGPAYYGGVLAVKPVIGEGMREPFPKDIGKTLRIFYLSSVLALFVFCCFRLVLIYVGGFS